ncbi:MAG TPA: PD-(D/E)XK nuclease family protein [Verrucomicrobiota bacterium]|nr:PD-(D/E)XK nuclease family protein [Verrucomicrobiota bacterium]
MAILTKSKVPSGHWYRSDGTPVHKLPTADGRGERATTIGDARRLGLYPSVTSILGILAKPGLEKWKLDQVALATLRTPKQAEESEDYWCNRVRNAAFDQVEAAADLGTMIHGALELAMAGEPYSPDLRPYVEPVLAWRDKVGIRIVEREIKLVNKEHGFAGTADVLFRFGQHGIGILDYKTRKTKPGEEVVAYDNQAMQLAAYGATYWGEENVGRLLAANIFISTTEPGRYAVVKHPDVARDWQAFCMVAALWRYIKGYDPRQQAAA